MTIFVEFNSFFNDAYDLLDLIVEIRGIKKRLESHYIEISHIPLMDV